MAITKKDSKKRHRFPHPLKAAKHNYQDFQKRSKDYVRARVDYIKNNDEENDRNTNQQSDRVNISFLIFMVAFALLLGLFKLLDWL